LRRLFYTAIIFVFVLAPLILSAKQPGFYADLGYPSAYISPYPELTERFLIALNPGDSYQVRSFRRIYTSRVKTIRSSFDDNSLTFSGSYYKKGEFEYEYTARTVDAAAFSEWRRRYNLEDELVQLRALALTKAQKDKAGGLLSFNIPVKSKTFESVFGEGGAGIKVSGYHKITFSGRSTWRDQASTATSKQSKFPSLNMEQISRFDINGNIGSKVTVAVSHDSKTDIPLANRLILRYKGDEDDILKSVEAGNTTLSLPNTKFVGYSQSIKGLFGIKTEAQIGSLNLTAIASQEKGNTERTTIEAGASASMNYIRDYQYAYGRIFDLGRVDTTFYDADNLDFYDGDSIVYIEVWRSSQSSWGVSTSGAANPKANLYVDPNDTANYKSEFSEAYVEQVDAEQYVINPTEGWILFDAANAGTSHEIGVYMEIKRASGAIDTIGDISREGTLEKPYFLKLIKHATPDASYVTWNYEWRNVYYLGGSSIDVSGLEINVLKGGNGSETNEENLDHQGGIKYIEILGLDRYDQSGRVGSDGLVDVETSIVDASRGLLIFPNRTPFMPSYDYVDSVTLDPSIPDIYNTTYSSTNVIEASTYYLQVSNLSRKAEVSLGRANILENSERITVNGRELVKGTDYNISYDFGQVTFLTDEALDPNADIQIDFEYTPYITAQKKTLFGIRGEYEFSKNFNIGSTFLYKSDKATERKPKVGQETSRQIMWDGDISFKIQPNILTSLADALPLFSTEVASNLRVEAELAKSFPNPNVDGAAYIDDFEGGRESYSLGIVREAWTRSSRPVGLDDTYLRGKMIWYNPYTPIATDQIWDRDVTQDQSGTHTLWVQYTPIDSILESGPANSWDGVMRYMSAGSVNQDDAQLLELRVLGGFGILHIDLGDISEDVDGDGVLDSEDIQDPLTGIRNGILDSGEDVGLDGKVDNEEDGYDSVNNPDPNGDNWYYNGYGAGCNGCGPNDYSHINGTEGNEQDPNRYGRPDTEDIDGSEILDKKNNYFSYAIDLSSDEFLVENSEWPENAATPWRTFRIPIRDSASIDSEYGEPRWTQITYIRMWFESPDNQPFTMAIAAANLIHSSWDDTITVHPGNESLMPASEFSVATINNQENIDYRNDPPPGVTGYYDKQNDIYEVEQSMLLHYESLIPGDTCIAQKVLYDTPSYMGYRKLNMLVHGPTGVENDSIVFFFRVGNSENEFYEFRTLLKSGWHLDNEVNINFDEITALKQFLIEAQEDNPDTNQIVDSTGHYRVYGNPTITRVKYLTCGLVNISGDTVYNRAEGDVWVNELRLTDVRGDAGTAARASLGGNVADLFTYSASYNYQDSYFRKISSSTRAGSSDNLGSGETTTSYSLSTSFNLDKLIPRSLNAKIPVSLRYSKSTDVPRLKFGTDIVLPTELQDEQSTIIETKSFSVSEAFSKQTRNPLFTLLLNKFRSSFSYTRSEGRSPRTPYSFTESYRFGGSYSFSVNRPPGVRPFFWTQPIPYLNKLSGNHLYFLPTNFTAKGDMDRSLKITENSSGVTSETLTRSFTGNSRLNYKISENLNVNFNMSTKRDLSDPNTVNIVLNPKKFRLGRELSYTQGFGATYTPSIFSFLTHSFNFSADYRERANVSDSSLYITSSKGYGVSGSFDMKKFFSTAEEDQSHRRHSRRRAKPDEETDSTKVEEDKDKKRVNPIKAVLNPAKKLMGFLTGWLNPITYNYNDNYAYSYNGLTDRASLEYRFGLTENIGVPLKQAASGSTHSTSVSRTTGYTIKSGTEFFGGLKTDVLYSKKISKDIVKVTNPRKSILTTFPDISFSIRPMTTFKFLNPFIKKFSPRTGFSRSTDENFNIQTGIKNSSRTTVRQNPLLSLNFNFIRSMTINFTTDKSVSETKSYNSQTGDLSSRSRSTTRNTSIDIKYSFTSPRGIKIPIFGRMRFRSTLSLSANISYRTQKTENAAKEGAYGTTGNEKNLTISPTVSYKFSSQIQGGLTAKWQDTDSVSSGSSVKSHTRELKIWVDIKF